MLQNVFSEIEMRKSMKESKKVYFLSVILVFLVSVPWMVFGKALDDEFTFDIDQFKITINSSPEECWKQPAQNRKNAICNKLTELQLLITCENFEEAYDKLLHDIKPKLTGLKHHYPTVLQVHFVLNLSI